MVLAASATSTASGWLDRLVILLLFSVLLSGGFLPQTDAQKLQKVFIDDITLSIEPHSKVLRDTNVILRCQPNIRSYDEKKWLTREYTIYKNNELIHIKTTRTSEDLVYSLPHAQVSNSGNYSCGINIQGEQKMSSEQELTVKALLKPLLHFNKSVVMEGEELTATCTAPGETGSVIFYFYDGTTMIDIVENSYEAELKFRLNGKDIHQIHCFYSVILETILFYSDESNSIMVEVKELPFTLVMEIAPQSKIYVGDEFFISCTVSNSSDDPFLNSGEPKLLLYEGYNLLATGGTKVNHRMLAKPWGHQEFECELEMGKIKKTTTKKVPVLALPVPILHVDKSVVMEQEELTATCTSPGKTGNNRYVLRDATKMVDKVENSYKAEIKFRLNGKGIHQIHCFYGVSLGTTFYGSYESNSIMVEVKELPFTLVMEITPQSKICVGDEFFISCTVSNRFDDPYLNTEEPRLFLYHGQNLLARGATKVNHSMKAKVRGLQGFQCEFRIGDVQIKTTERIWASALPKPLLNLDKSLVMEQEELTATCTAPGETGSILFYFYDGIKMIDMVENSYKAELKFCLNSKGIHWIHCKYRVGATETFYSSESNPVIVQVKELPFTLVVETTPQSGIYVGDEFFISCAVSNSSDDPYPNTEEPKLLLYQGNNLLATGATKVNHSMVALASGSQGLQCEFRIGYAQIKTTERIWVSALPKPLLHLDKSVVMEGEELTATCMVPGKTGSILFYFYDGTKEIAKEQVNSNQGEIKFHLESKGYHKIHCDYNVIIGGYSFNSNGSSSVMVQVKELLPPVLEITAESMIFEGDELFISCTVSNSSEDPLPSSGHPSLYLYQGNKELARGVTKVKHSMVTLTSGHQEFECELDMGKIKKTTIKEIPVWALPVPILHVDKTVVMEGEEVTAICMVPSKTDSILFYFYDHSKEIAKEQIYSDQVEVNFRLNGEGNHWIHCEYRVGVTETFHSKESNYIIVQVKELPFTLVMEIFPQSGIYVGDEFFISCTVTNSSDDPYLNTEEPRLFLYQENNLLTTGTTKVNHKMVALASGPQGLQCEFRIGYAQIKTTETIWVSVSASTPKMSVVGQVVVGRPFQILCQSDAGTLPINYTLMEDYEPLRTVSVERSSDQALFIINISRPEQIKRYRCEAKNSLRAGKLSEQLSAEVIEPLTEPTLIGSSKFPNLPDVSEGDHLHLVCSVKGTPPITFKWYRVGSELPLYTSTSSDTNATYQIPTLSKHHSGTYYCEADNQANNVVRSPQFVIEVHLALWKKGVMGGMMGGLCLVALVVSVVLLVLRFRSNRGIEPYNPLARWNPLSSSHQSIDTRGEREEVVELSV